MKIFDNLIFSTVLILTAILSAQDFEDLYFGTDSTFEILTWNIEWFPKNGQTTVDYVTAIIQALDVDVLAIQEVDNTDMFDQMLDNLADYEGYYESAWFAGLAYIYKTDVVEINEIYEIYTTSPYWKYVGEWKGNDFHGQGTMISTDGTKWVGDFRGNKPWNLSLFDKKGNINMK